jgi:two-component system sensor histidine kinase YesM
MSQDQIDAIFNCPTEENESFGLWGTVERVRIHYDCMDCVQVESCPSVGTKIIIYVEDKACGKAIKSDCSR